MLPVGTHDCSARRQPSICFGCFDHGERHPVLHAAGRILVLEFEENACAVGWRDVTQGHSVVLPMRCRMLSADCS